MGLGTFELIVHIVNLLQWTYNLVNQLPRIHQLSWIHQLPSIHQLPWIHQLLWFHQLPWLKGPSITVDSSVTI